VPGAVGALGDVVADAGAQAPQVAVGVGLLPAGGGAQGELTVEVVVVQVADAGGQLAPPAVVLVLGEGGGEVAAQVVVGIAGANLQALLVEPRRQADAPGVVEAVAG